MTQLHCCEVGHGQTAMDLQSWMRERQMFDGKGKAEDRASLMDCAGGSGESSGVFTVISFAVVTIRPWMVKHVSPLHSIPLLLVWVLLSTPVFIMVSEWHSVAQFTAAIQRQHTSLLCRALTTAPRVISSSWLISPMSQGAQAGGGRRSCCERSPAHHPTSTHVQFPNGMTLPRLQVESHWTMLIMGTHGCLLGLMGTPTSHCPPIAPSLSCLHLLSPTTICLSPGQTFCLAFLGDSEGTGVFCFVKGHPGLPLLEELVRTGQIWVQRAGLQSEDAESHRPSVVTWGGRFPQWTVLVPSPSCSGSQQEPPRNAQCSCAAHWCRCFTYHGMKLSCNMRRSKNCNAQRKMFTPLPRELSKTEFLCPYSSFLLLSLEKSFQCYVISPSISY